ncbi:hypothetical protein OC610_05115, partial [Pseudomonas sp. SAICEU22]
LRWGSSVAVCLGILYFTNQALSGGKVSIWARAWRAVKLRVGRLPWHTLQHQGLVVVIVVLVMAATVYWRMKGVA